MAKAPGKRRRLYPMPVEPFVDHPLILTFPAAGFGILMRLALHFWTTECRPLPIADHELRAIGRVHTPTWRHWKAPVMQAFHEIQPELEAYFRLREARQTHLTRLGTIGGGVTRLKALRVAARSPEAGVTQPRRAHNAPEPALQSDSGRLRRTG